MIELKLAQALHRQATLVFEVFEFELAAGRRGAVARKPPLSGAATKSATAATIRIAAT